ADAPTLHFQHFFGWNGEYPPIAVGRNAVLHLISEDIYLDIKFISWSDNGFEYVGFAYVRSTPVKLLTLNGPSQLSVLGGSSFTDPGATAVDLQGNPLPVTVIGTVDTNTGGTYELTYTATDSEGHTDSISRTVDVVSIIVSVYSGYTRSGGGAPYSSL